jgi:hypothetical protein
MTATFLIPSIILTPFAPKERRGSANFCPAT